VESILAAWKVADVVCLGEAHQSQHDSDLRIALIQHRAFPQTVKVIAVEFASPIHQALLDRFILDGRAMSREELAPVWRESCCGETWESPIYEQFFRAVQQLNLKLQRNQRVRVIAGDSPHDWSRIKKPEDLVPQFNLGGNLRNINIRNIIVQQLLEPRVKGLAVYGTSHCDKTGQGFPGHLAGQYGQGRIWSIEPLASAEASRKGQEVFGFGGRPTYVVIAGTRWGSTPAGEMLGSDPQLTMGNMVDALIYHGEVPDTQVPADLTRLSGKYRSEFERRRALTNEAFKLLPRR
jgi:hypothetical protein